MLKKARVFPALVLALTACPESDDPPADSATETSDGDGDGDGDTAPGDGDGDTPGDGDGDPAGDGDGDSGDGDGDSGDGDGDSGDGDGDSGDGDGDTGDGDGDTGDGDGDLGPSPCIEQPPGWSSIPVGAFPGEFAWSDGEAFIAYENYSVLIHDGEQTHELVPGGFINHVWARGIDDVWIAAGETATWLYSAGGPGKLWHFDGSCLEAVLEPSDGLGFAGVTGNEDGTLMWALEEGLADDCENLCDGSVAAWHFEDGEWILDLERLDTSGEDPLVPRLTYDGLRAWSYYGDRPQYWTAFGWEQPPQSSHATGFIAVGDRWWAYDGDLDEGRVAYYDGQSMSADNIGEDYFAPDDPNFAGVMGPRVGHDPVLAWTTAFIPELPTALVQLDGGAWSELAVLPDDVVVSDLAAWTSDELLLSTYQNAPLFNERKYELVDVSGPDPVLSTLIERSHRSCNDRLTTTANMGELMGSRGHSVRHRDALGEWTQADYAALDYTTLTWFAGPEDGWIYDDQEDALYRYGPDGPELYEDAWSPNANFVQRRELWGVASDEVYALHSTFAEGWLYRWDGVSWSEANPEPLPRSYQLHAAGDTLAILAQGELLVRTGDVWTSTAVDIPGINYDFSRVWVSGPERVWLAASNGGLWTWDGVELLDASAQWPELDQQLDLSGIRMFAGTGDELYIHSRGLISHFDGVAWNELDVPAFESVTAVAWTGAELVVDGCAQMWTYTP